MFVYVLAKAVRLGYLPKSYLSTAVKGWNGILKNLVSTGPNGEITIVATVKGIDLGSAPSHDGSYSYYVHAPVVSNDVKGIGAFLLAATEIERADAAHAKASRSPKAD
jgi:unsaturated rhamnogalacturonyl hydrolase